jgi:PPOX class probable F420-dependent enzyme
VAPVWFVVEGNEIVFNTGRATAKGHAVLQDPPIVLCVDLERPPYAYVQVQGVATVSENPAELVRTATAIGARYMGADRAEEFGRRNGVPGELVVRLAPTKVLHDLEVTACGADDACRPPRCASGARLLVVRRHPALTLGVPALGQNADLLRVVARRDGGLGLPPRRQPDEERRDRRGRTADRVGDVRGQVEDEVDDRPPVDLVGQAEFLRHGGDPRLHHRCFAALCHGPTLTGATDTRWPVGTTAQCPNSAGMRPNSWTRP